MGSIAATLVADNFKTMLDGIQRPEVGYKPLTAVSLFSGGGGLDLGLEAAGFHVAYASDIEPPHCLTLSANFPSCYVEVADVNQQKGSDIIEKANVGEIDLLAGGPPCQSFSILGKRMALDDPRGKLVYEYARIVKELRPRAFVFENVPGILTVNKGMEWRALLDFMAESTGYKIYYQVLNSVNYGAPQIRKRVFMVGFRDQNEFTFPMPTHGPTQLGTLNSLIPWATAKEGLEGVEALHNHRIRPHGERVKSRYMTVEPGGRDKIDHTDRLHPDRPSGTVIVGSRGGGGRPFIHFSAPRHLTVREAARLQTFPDWFKFESTETWQYRAVGNAVPVFMARAVGKQIALALQ